MRPIPIFSFALAALVCGALIPGLAASRMLPDFVDLVAENGPSVVNISTKQAPVAATQLPEFSVPDLPEDSPLQDFFRHFFGEDGAFRTIACNRARSGPGSSSRQTDPC